MLNIAPNRQITNVLRRLSPFTVRIDLDPAADRRAVDVQADLCRTPFRDGTFDFIICYHVLEHIPDDIAAMRELARTLAHGGFGLVQVPWRPVTATDEDPTATVEERIRRFGQPDHVRHYGADFEDRLHVAGLEFLRFTVQDVLPPELIERFRLTATENLWIVRRAIREPRPLAVAPGALRLTLAKAVAALLSAQENPARHLDATRDRDGRTSSTKRHASS